MLSCQLYALIISDSSHELPNDLDKYWTDVLKDISASNHPRYQFCNLTSLKQKTTSCAHKMETICRHDLQYNRVCVDPPELHSYIACIFVVENCEVYSDRVDIHTYTIPGYIPKRNYFCSSSPYPSCSCKAAKHRTATLVLMVLDS